MVHSVNESSGWKRRIHGWVFAFTLIKTGCVEESDHGCPVPAVYIVLLKCCMWTLQTQLDLWLSKTHLEPYFGLGLDSDFRHPKVQIVNVELIELLARKQTSGIVFQTHSRCRKMSWYVGAKLLLYDWRKLLLCNQEVLKWYENI